jgi:hypothetical protein
VIVRPNDTVVLALSPELRATNDQLREVREEMEELFGNNIKVIPLVGLKDSFIVRSDET